MKAENLTNRILKAALLLILTITTASGQNRWMSVERKSVGKRVYKCKHVGKQKVVAKKFTKREIRKYITADAKRRQNQKTADTLFRLPESNVELYASVSDFNLEVVKVEEKIDRIPSIPLPKPVYFRFDTDELTYEDLDQIILAIEHMKRGCNIILEGHTDSHGASHYNKALSMRRAIKIKNMMVEMGGVNPDRIEVQFFGEEKPAVENTTDENRQLNRRVEFVVLQ